MAIVHTAFSQTFEFNNQLNPTAVFGDATVADNVVSLDNIASGTARVEFSGPGDSIAVSFDYATFPASGSGQAQVRLNVSWEEV